jgi:DNA-binding MarR family transcriptional regulator
MTTTNLTTLRDIFVPICKDTKVDLSIRQIAVLSYIHCTSEKLSVGPIAARLNLSKPAVTRALNKLETMGCIKRNPDPKDKRKIEITTPKAGKVLIARLEKIVALATTGAAPVAPLQAAA